MTSCAPFSCRTRTGTATEASPRASPRLAPPCPASRPQHTLTPPPRAPCAWPREEHRAITRQIADRVRRAYDKHAAKGGIDKDSLVAILSDLKALPSGTTSWRQLPPTTRAELSQWFAAIHAADGTKTTFDAFLVTVSHAGAHGVHANVGAAEGSTRDLGRPSPGQVRTDATQRCAGQPRSKGMPRCTLFVDPCHSAGYGRRHDGAGQVANRALVPPDASGQHPVRHARRHARVPL